MTTPTGITITLAGDSTAHKVNGQDVAMRFYGPSVIDMDVTVYVGMADGWNHRIRRVAAGLIPTSSVRVTKLEIPNMVANLAKPQRARRRVAIKNR
jgi:hypothetical protein